MIIGIIGGGQLGLMMAESAKSQGHSVIGLDPNPFCPLSHVADKMIVSEYNDPTNFDNFASYCDVITYEFENVDLELVKKYQDKIPQGYKALEYSRHRIIEKDFASSLGIKTPKYKRFESEEDFFYPSIIKTCTGGYDGKGQKTCDKKCDIYTILNNDKELIIEEKIDFDYEISVVLTRDYYGNIKHLPVTKNIHERGILHLSYATNSVDESLVIKAVRAASKIIKELDYIGTLCVEFFVVADEILFNEYAPRPHNSGHYSIDGCDISQFDNHVFAISKSKVKDVHLLSNTVMINVLGKDVDYKENCKKITGAIYKDYYKTESRVYRKMAHINICGSELEDKVRIIKES